MSEHIIDVTDGFIESYGQFSKGEIVRCRDCGYYEPNTYSHFTCKLLQYHVESNNFCAWGERRRT